MLSISVCRAGRCLQFVEECEARILAQTGCSTEERKKKLQGCCMTSMMSKWYVICVILRLGKRLKDGSQLHVGGIDGIRCQYLPLMMTQLQTHWEWHGSEKETHSMFWPAWTSRRPSTWRHQSILRTLLAIKMFTDGFTAALYRDMAGLQRSGNIGKC